MALIAQNITEIDEIENIKKILQYKIWMQCKTSADSLPPPPGLVSLSGKLIRLLNKTAQKC